MATMVLSRNDPQPESKVKSNWLALSVPASQPRTAPSSPPHGGALPGMLPITCKLFYRPGTPKIDGKEFAKRGSGCHMFGEHQGAECAQALESVWSRRTSTACSVAISLRR